MCILALKPVTLRFKCKEQFSHNCGAAARTFIIYSVAFSRSLLKMLNKAGLNTKYDSIPRHPLYLILVFPFWAEKILGSGG